MTRHLAPTPTVAHPLSRRPHLHIRALRPGETQPLLDVFAGLSARSRFRRYQTGLPELTPTMLHVLSDLHAERHQAFVASAGGRAVGIGRWVRLSASSVSAEIALEVTDDAQGRGVGAALAQAVAASAASAGMVTLVATVLASNDPVRRWLRQVEAHPHPDEPGSYVVGVSHLAQQHEDTGRAVA